MRWCRYVYYSPVAFTAGANFGRNFENEQMKGGLFHERYNRRGYVAFWF